MTQKLGPALLKVPSGLGWGGGGLRPVLPGPPGGAGLSQAGGASLRGAWTAALVTAFLTHPPPPTLWGDDPSSQ